PPGVAARGEGLSAVLLSPDPRGGFVPGVAAVGAVVAGAAVTAIGLSDGGSRQASGEDGGGEKETLHRKLLPASGRITNQVGSVFSFGRGRPTCLALATILFARSRNCDREVHGFLPIL